MRITVLIGMLAIVSAGSLLGQTANSIGTSPILIGKKDGTRLGTSPILIGRELEDLVETFPELQKIESSFELKNVQSNYDQIRGSLDSLELQRLRNIVDNGGELEVVDPRRNEKTKIYSIDLYDSNPVIEGVREDGSQIVIYNSEMK